MRIPVKMNEKALGRYFLLVILVLAVGISAWAESVPREAQKHMNRGMAAAEIAKSPAEYEEAIREFEQAVSLAPDWPAPYFNLGCVQKEAGKYQEALSNYRKYLELVPNAPDAEQVQAEIDQIEYRLEKVSEAGKIRSWLEGEWTGSPGAVPFNWSVRFVVNGDSVKMYAPITWNADEGAYVDYKTIPIKQEGKNIQLSVVLKLKVNSRDPLVWVENAQYNLNLITPDRMEGTKVASRKEAHTGELIFDYEAEANFSKN